MIIRLVKMEFNPEMAEEFLSIFKQVRPKIECSKGCKSLVLIQDIESQNVFFTYSIWDNVDSLEAYRDSTLFMETWSMVKKLFSKPAQAWSTRELIEL